MAYATGTGTGTRTAMARTTTTARNGTVRSTLNGKTPTYSKINKVKYVTGGTNSNLVLTIDRSDSATVSGISDPSAVNITNVGSIPIVCMLGYEAYTNETADSATVYLHAFLKPGESMQPPLFGVVSLQGSETATTHTDFADQAAYNLDTTALDWTAPSDDLKADSGADVKNDTLNNTTDPVNFGVTVSASANSQYIFVGDLLRIENEIFEVLGTYEEDPTNSSLVEGDIRCKRGMFGSTTAAHSGTPDIYFPYFNTRHEFDKFTSGLAPGATAGYAQTDASGSFSSNNFFGLGRNSNTAPRGITPGSAVFRFYSRGQQEIGAQNLTSATNSGLAVSTEYKFNITINGGTTKTNIAFTTDSSNVNFGGTNGVISKIQAALDAEFYDESSNLFETKVTVSIIGGDIVFISNNNLASSAVLLANPSSGTTPWAVGRLKAAASMKTAVPAKLPDGQDLVIYDPVTYEAQPNAAVLAYDRGDRVITGVCGGTIHSYETGAFTLTGAPPNANFEYSVIYNTPFSGKRDATEGARANVLGEIRANVLNAKIQGSIKVELYK